MNNFPNITIGIDAANLRRGGGLTHLIEILNFSNPQEHGVGKVIVWAGKETLRHLPERPWLQKINPSALNHSVFRATLWQFWCLSLEAKRLNCDVLFVPGGSYAGKFKPIVTMSRNLLPFEWVEMMRFGKSTATIKLLLLRFTQSRSYRNADGVIFLTRYAKKVVMKVVGALSGRSAIISHGLNPVFLGSPKIQHPIDDYSYSHPFRILYVSIIDEHKHQCNVVEAVSYLRKDGFPVSLELVGPAYPPALEKLLSVISRLDSKGDWVRYRGSVDYSELHKTYARADLGVFASSCENMPNILLETMASGLPIASSNKGPMPEILGDDGVYFNPEDPLDIYRALRVFILSPEERSIKSRASFANCQHYSWKRCADETFRFLVKIASPK